MWLDLSNQHNSVVTSTGFLIKDLLSLWKYFVTSLKRDFDDAETAVIKILESVQQLMLYMRLLCEKPQSRFSIFHLRSENKVRVSGYIVWRGYFVQYNVTVIYIVPLMRNWTKSSLYEYCKFRNGSFWMSAHIISTCDFYQLFIRTR